MKSETTDLEFDNNVTDSSTLDLMCRLKGGVLLKIWPQILIVFVYTTGVVAVHNYVPGMKMDFPQTLIPLLGIVMGLLLVFRTNTAYDRYWEGRKIWAQMTLNIRTLTRCIWTGVEERDENAHDLIEKLSVINLLVAFPFAVKNYLRGEYSYDDGKDLKELISHLPRFATPSSTLPLRTQQDSGSRRESTVTSPTVVYAGDQTPVSKQDTSKSKNVVFLAHDYPTPTNIPIEISYYFASYLSLPRTKETLGPLMSTMNGALTSLVDCLTAFERILRTPIPLAYSVHLHHSLWLYLLALPYQLVGQLNWWTIVVVTLASFALLGILAIGKEIENPFGTDYNDLPLDDFCKVLQREVYVMVGRSMPSPESWILSRDNHPLAPASFLTAEQLSNMSTDAIRVLLAHRGQQSEPPPPPAVVETKSPETDGHEGPLQVVSTSLRSQSKVENGIIGSEQLDRQPMLTKIRKS